MNEILKKAHDALQKRQWTEALEGFVTCLSQSPNHLASLDGLSYAFAGQSLWQEAIDSLQLILQHHAITNASQAKLWQRIAEYYQRLELYQSSIQAYQKSFSLHDASHDVLLRFAHLLIKAQQAHDAYRVIQKVLQQDSHNRHAFTLLGKYYEYLGKNTEAIQSYSAIAAIEPKDHENLRKLSTLLNHKVPTWHFPMMNDTPRNQAFCQAIEQLVTPDTRVLDIGSGAGLLSLIAARAGAQAVYACESEQQVAEVALDIIQKNEYEDTIRLIAKRSTEMKVGFDLPDRLDLLVCEIFDVSLLGEDALYTIHDAKARLLKEGARIIPCKARVWVQLVESDELRARYHVEDALGFDLSAFNALQDPRVLQLDLKRFDYKTLTDPILAFEVDFEQDFKLMGEYLCSSPVIQTGRADGFIFWYDLVLDEANDTILSTSPHQDGTHWLQGFAPSYEKQHKLTLGESTNFICAYRRFLLWFKHLAF